MGMPTDELEQRCSMFQEELARVGDLRLGSLIYRYRRCGKSGCLCSDPKHPGHGGWIVSKQGWRENGDEHRAARGAVADNQATTRRGPTILEACP